jgi:hypothetical protein
MAFAVPFSQFSPLEQQFPANDEFTLPAVAKVSKKKKSLSQTHPFSFSFFFLPFPWSAWRVSSKCIPKFRSSTY